MSVVRQIAERHFGKKAIKALARKGVFILGVTTVAGQGPLPYAQGSQEYEISDNGCYKIRSYSEILKLAA